MRNILFLFSMLWGGLLLHAEDFVTIHVEKAGTLELTEASRLTTRLRVTGKVDARDFMKLKEVTLTRVKELDMAQAVIQAYCGEGGSKEDMTPDWVQGGESLTDYPANTLPIHAFAEVCDNSIRKTLVGSSTLCRLVLPLTLEGIQPDALAGCSQLSEIVLPQGAALRSQGTHALLSADGKQLLAVAPGYAGALELPATLERVEPSAWQGLRLKQLIVKGDKVPEMKNQPEVGYVVAKNPADWKAVFPKTDCVKEIIDITLDEVTEGTLTKCLSTLAQPDEVRSLRVLSGTLGQADVDALYNMPYLHKVDLAGAKVEVSKLVVPRQWTDLKLPQGNKSTSLEIAQKSFLTGKLEVPAGYIYVNNERGGRFTEIVLGADVKEITANSFSQMPVKRIDLSACRSLLTLSNLSNVPHLQSLLLPPALRELIGVSGNALQQIELPATLQRITGCHDWEVTSLSLPASLEVIEDMGYMPRLQSVNLAACTKLVVCTDFMDACPLLKEVDFSATSMRKFTGLGTIFVPSGVVVTGGSRYKPYSYVGIKKVKFPSTLQTLEAFEHAKNLARLDLSACTQLTVLRGLKGTALLDSLVLPIQLTDMSACDFSQSSSLRAMTVWNPTAPAMKSNERALREVVLTVPMECGDSYRQAEAWSDCKEIKEAGCVVCVKLPEEAAQAVEGQGGYELGESVTLRAKRYAYDKVMDYEPEGWLVNGKTYADTVVTFVVEGHVTAEPLYRQAIHLERGDAFFVLEVDKDTVITLNYALADMPNEKTALYSMDNRTPLATQGGQTLCLTLKKQSENRFAIVGQVISLGFDHYPSWGEKPIRMKEIQFNNRESLRTIVLNYLDLPALTLNDSPELTNCDIYGNQLQTLDLSGCPQLNWLEAGENRLESVSLPEASRLANLFLNDNNLSTLDVTSMPALRRLRVGGNKLRSIDLRPCCQLEEAFLADNLLTEAQFPSGKVWIDINENPGAFSFFTPELYETYCQKGGELTIKMKVDEDYVKRTSVLDLTQEFTANEWTSATQVEFRCNGNVYQPQREGYKYYLQRGAHTVNLTNANYPALTAFAWFDVPNDYTGIENAEVHTPTFAWNAAGELILTGLTAGDKVTLYDLQGRLLVEQTAATRQLKFHIPRSASVLLLRIQQANRVIKHKLVRR